MSWAKAPEGQPVAALASEKHLFLVLLSADYMVPDTEKEVIRLPLEPPKVGGEIEITPPRGRSLVSGTTLSGAALSLRRMGNVFTVAFQCRGAGQMLVFELSAEARAPAARADDKNAADSTEEGRHEPPTVD